MVELFGESIKFTKQTQTNRVSFFYGTKQLR